MADNSPRTGISYLVFGFLGVIGTAFLLPRLLKFGFRRYFMGIASEILLILFSGLLTEKLVSYLSRDDAELEDVDPA